MGYGFLDWLSFVPVVIVAQLISGASHNVSPIAPSGSLTMGTEIISDIAVNPLTTVLGNLSELQQKLTLILW
jgi:hypothetical protein